MKKFYINEIVNVDLKTSFDEIVSVHGIYRGKMSSSKGLSARVIINNKECLVLFSDIYRTFNEYEQKDALFNEE